MNVTILGYTGSVQTADSSNTSLLVRTESTSILVDTSGSPCQAMLQAGQDPDSLDAVLLTHAHIDHIYALPSLIHNLWIRKRTKRLLIAGNEYAIEIGRKLFELFRMDRKTDICPIDWHVLPVDRVGDIEISTFPVFHRPHMPTNGFVFSSGKRKLAYFPDSVAKAPYPAPAQGADLVIHESGGLDVDREKLENAGHTSAHMACEVARALEAKRLMIVHLPQDMNQRDMIFQEAERSFSPVLRPRVLDTIPV
ncbi:MAG: MBL fold metallo-hydrolase [Spirochaetales bacterium]|nr:MBL fold metallo-hydrolase [Spirochaetales bacterium]